MPQAVTRGTHRATRSSRAIRSSSSIPAATRSSRATPSSTSRVRRQVQPWMYIMYCELLPAFDLADYNALAAVVRSHIAADPAAASRGGKCSSSAASFVCMTCGVLMCHVCNPAGYGQQQYGGPPGGQPVYVQQPARPQGGGGGSNCLLACLAALCCCCGTPGVAL